jgi:uncharacterized protein YkwD
LIPDTGNLRVVERATLCLVNKERRAHGVAPLARDGALARAAARYSRAMVRGGYFADVSPSGSTVARRVSRAGYAGSGRAGSAASAISVGENLATASGALATPREIVASWMASPPHRANLLSRAFRASGIGVALGMPRSVAPARTLRAATYTQELGSRR